MHNYGGDERLMEVEWNHELEMTGDYMTRARA
jgi:hypothetical protein